MRGTSVKQGALTRAAENAESLLYLDWRRYGLGLAILVLGVGGWFGFREISYRLNHVALDGTVEGDVVIASPNIGGRLAALNVSLGEPVARGELIGRLDSAEPQAAVKQAEAALKGSAAGVAESQVVLNLQKGQSLAEIAQAQADASVARANLEQARRETQDRLKSDRFRIDQARAAVKAARARLAKLQAGPRQEEVRVALAAVNSASAVLNQAKARAARLEQLNKKGFFSQQELEMAQTDQRVAEGQLQAAEERAKLLQAGARPEDLEAARQEVAAAEAALKLAESSAHDLVLRQLELQKREAELTGARARLEGSKATSRQVNQRAEELLAARAEQEKTTASLAAAQAALAEAEIRSPVSGIVTRLPLHVGEVVSAGQPIAVIVSREKLWIEARLPETKVRRVHPGQLVEVYLEAYPKRRLRGRVALVQPATATRSDVGQASQDNPEFGFPEVPIIIAFDYPGLKPLPGMSARLSIATGR